MHRVADVAGFLERFAPPQLAESWDNVGLLVGDAQWPVERVMTCLTVTPQSAAEAVARRAQLIVTHHPLPFRPLKRLTADTPEGRLLLDLIAAHVAVYSPHTGFDSALEGINQLLAEGLGLSEIGVLVPAQEGPLGTGRSGRAAPGQTLADLAAQVKRFLQVEPVGIVGRADAPLRQVAVLCGSAGELFAAAQRAGCDAVVTGELRFHACLEAEAAGLAVVLAGHFASERFALVQLAAALSREFPRLEIWASQRERDPIAWL